MSSKLVCDKCGMILEDKFVRLNMSDCTVPGEYPTQGTKDLCPKCYKDFKNWLDRPIDVNPCFERSNNE